MLITGNRMVSPRTSCGDFERVVRGVDRSALDEGGHAGPAKQGRGERRAQLLGGKEQAAVELLRPRKHRGGVGQRAPDVTVHAPAPHQVGNRHRKDEEGAALEDIDARDQGKALQEGSSEHGHPDDWVASNFGLFSDFVAARPDEECNRRGHEVAEPEGGLLRGPRAPPVGIGRPEREGHRKEHRPNRGSGPIEGRLLRPHPCRLSMCGRHGLGADRQIPFLLVCRDLFVATFGPLVRSLRPLRPLCDLSVRIATQGALGLRGGRRGRASCRSCSTRARLSRPRLASTRGGRRRALSGAS